MSEAVIYSTLAGDVDVSAIIGTRIYPVIRPQNAASPYIVYNREIGISINGLEGELGTTRGRFEVNVYSYSYAEVKDIAIKVRAALRTQPALRGALISDRDFGKEIDTDLYRVLMEFRYWFVE